MFSIIEDFLNYAFVSDTNNNKNKESINQIGKGLYDYEKIQKYNEYLQQMRKPMESNLDIMLPKVNTLMKEHMLSFKDALYIAVAEEMYPEEAKKYYSTVNKLEKSGHSLEEAVTRAFSNYMIFYKNINTKKK